MPPKNPLSPTRIAAAKTAARRVAVLELLREKGEVTADELSTAMGMEKASGTLGHLFRAKLIKSRLSAERDSYRNRIKYYSLAEYDGPERKLEANEGTFLLGQVWGGGYKTPDHKVKPPVFQPPRSK